MIFKKVYIIQTMLTPNNSKYYRQKSLVLQGMRNLCGAMCQVLAHDKRFFHGEPTCLFETLDAHVL
jgi:hypothetical protein